MCACFSTGIKVFLLVRVRTNAAKSKSAGLIPSRSLLRFNADRAITQKIQTMQLLTYKQKRKQDLRPITRNMVLLRQQN